MKSIGILLCLFALGSSEPLWASAPPEELFQIATEYYRRAANSPPWPDDLPSGLAALTEAAEAGYAPALQSLALAYEFGYLGGIDAGRAAYYRQKWAQIEPSPKKWHDIALIELKCRRNPNQPDKSDPSFIFTGAWAQINKTKSESYGLYGGEDEKDSGGGRRATVFLLACAQLGLSNWPGLSESDLFAVHQALSILCKSAAGQTNRVLSDKGLHEVIKVIPPVAFEPAQRAEIFRTIILGRKMGAALPPEAFDGARKLLFKMGHAELQEAFSSASATKP